MKYFLVYLDILGYGEKAKGEAERAGRPVEDIRDSYIASLESRLTELERGGVVATQKTTGYGDDWLVFTDTVWKALRIVSYMLQAKIPLAVAVGTGHYEGPHLLARGESTISFLKTRIVPKYAAFYKKTRRQSPGQTFVLFTREAYRELGFTDIGVEPYRAAGFYCADQVKLERKLEVLDFLEKIGSDRIEYREIDRLYVEPTDLNHVREILKEHNIVFIIGDAELGKTYTAIRLLLDYSREGYRPVYYPEEGRESQWRFFREGPEMSGKAIYLEDPWDKVEFKHTGGICRTLGELVRRARKGDCKVMITSRERVFVEFTKRMETVEDISVCVHRMSLPSAYGETERRYILDNYVEVFHPVWESNRPLRSKAVQLIRDKLHTPMSIKQFVDNTLESDNESQLLAGAETAAAETKLCFAREIDEMFRVESYDRLIFLSFPCFRSHVVNLGMANTCYDEVLRGLSEMGYSRVQAKEFKALQREFERIVEIDTQYDCLRYVHPVYRGAFESALVEDGGPTPLSKHIFSKVVVELSRADRFGRRTSMIVHNHFERLPVRVREELLLKIAKKAPSSAALTIAMRFSQVSQELQAIFLDLLSDGNSADSVALAIAYGLDDFTPSLRRRLLLELAGREQSAETLTRCMLWSFLELPPTLRNEILPKLAERDAAAGKVAVIVLDYFAHIPARLRGRLLLALSSKDQAAKNTARAVADYFDEIPAQLRNRLLRRLSTKKGAGYPVARAILNHFSDVPQDIRSALQDLPDETRQEILMLSRIAPLQCLTAISQVHSEIDSRFVLKLLRQLGQSEDPAISSAARSLSKSLGFSP